MAKEREIVLKFSVDDVGSMKLESIKGNIDKAAQSVSNMDKALSVIKWDSIINLAERAGAAFKQVFDFAEMGAKVKSIEDSFKTMTINVGVSGDSLIRKMKEMTNATIDDTVLMQKAMRGLSEGFSPDQLIALGEAARVAARYMGTDVKSAFESVIDSLINLRARGLKTAGFIVDMDEAFKKHATTLGIDADALNDYGKTMALTNEIIDQTIRKKKELGGLQEEEFERFQKVRAAADEYKETIAKVASTLTNKFLSALNDIGNWVADNPEVLNLLTGLPITNLLPKPPTTAVFGEEGLAELAGKSQTKTEITAPEKDWIKEWVASFHTLIDTMKELGVTSQLSFSLVSKSALENLAIVKQAWKEGKATGLDYYNSMKAASDILKKGMGDQGDQTQKLFDLSEDYEKSIKAISWEDPERKKKVQELIDKWIEARGKILEATKTPVQIAADIAPAEKEFEKLKSDYEKYKSEIENNPIKINIENSYSGGGGAGFSGASPIAFPSDVETNVNFTATGLSPKISLGDAFKKIMANFSSMEETASGMEAVIEFQEYSNQLRNLQEQYDLITESAASWVQTMRMFSPLVNPNQLDYIQGLNAMQEDLFYQMKTYQLQIAEQMYSLGMPGAEEEFWSIFKSKYTPPVYQYGTDYVPKTGLAMVHQGEKITPANQNFAMGGNTFNITGNDPKAIAEEVANILTYKRSGSLAKAIKKTANS